jgi:hypothetical protein
MKITTRSAALTVAFTLAAAVPAFSANPNTIKVDPASVHRGKVVRVYGVVIDCQGSLTLISKAFPHTHDFAGLPAVYAKPAATGQYHVRVTIPASRKAGTYTISGRCGGGNIGVTRKLKVLS